MLKSSKTLRTLKTVYNQIMQYTAFSVGARRTSWHPNLFVIYIDKEDIPSNEYSLDLIVLGDYTREPVVVYRSNYKVCDDDLHATDWELCDIKNVRGWLVYSDSTYIHGYTFRNLHNYILNNYYLSDEVEDSIKLTYAPYFKILNAINNGGIGW